MAVKFMEGFDNGLLTEKGWSYSGTNWPYFEPTIQVTGGRYGGYCIYFRDHNSGTSAYKYFDSPIGPTVIIGFAFYWSYEVSSNQFFTLGGTNLYIDMVRPNLRIRNYAGTTLATSNTSFTTGAWYYVELKVVIHPTAGSVELRANGTPDVIATGINTGSTNGTYFQFYMPGNWGLGHQYLMCYFDDCYVADDTGSAPTNDFLGDCQVKGVFPLAEGANTAWTADSGTKVNRINEVVYDGDTSYIYANTVNNRETFTVSSVSVPTGNTIYAVQTNILARKADPGTRQIAPVIRMGGINYDGTTTVGLPDTYLDYTQIYDRVSPDGNAWTPTSFNNAEYGVVVK